MKFSKVLSFGLAAAVSVGLLFPMTANAQSIIDIDKDSHDTSIKEHINNIIHDEDTDINDSALIDNSVSDQNTGNTDNGSNSTATSNANKGDGVNTNVSSSDTVVTDVNFNVSNNSVVINNRNRDHTINNTDNFDRSRNTDYYKSYTSTTTVNSSNAGRTTTSNSSSATRSNSSAKKSNDKAASKKANDGNTITIGDELVPLAGGVDLSDGWQVVAKTNPTCEEDGSIEFYKEETDETYVQVLDAYGHTVDAKEVKAGLFSKGEVVTYCTECGKILSGNEDAVEASETSSSKLPAAGFFGTLGALILAIFKRH